MKNKLSALLLVLGCITIGATVLYSTDIGQTADSGSKIDGGEEQLPKVEVVKVQEEEDPPAAVQTIPGDNVVADFSDLLKQNSDTVGWITIPDSAVDYVVVQAKGDDERMAKGEDPYYLNTDFYGYSSNLGTIFMDYRSTLDGKNLILHGHHMMNGSMFSSIIYYDSLDYYKERPVFTFNTLYGNSEWKIVSIFKTNTLEEHGPFFDYLRGSFLNDYDFLDFVYQLRERSVIDCPVDLNENDTIVMLSTCAYDFSNFRCVVVARKVRDGEDNKVDVSKADYNPDTLYPDVWYYSKGGTKPEVTTFQDAYNKGKITWYDGDTKWSEKDDKTLAKLREKADKEQNFANSKIYAINDMINSVANTEYRNEEYEQLQDIIKEYTDKIYDAETSEDIEKLKTEGISKLKKVKTYAQLSG